LAYIQCKAIKLINDQGKRDLFKVIDDNLL
jgi:hypothetical protein